MDHEWVNGQEGAMVLVPGGGYIRWEIPVVFTRRAMESADKLLGGRNASRLPEKLVTFFLLLWCGAAGGNKAWSCLLRETQLVAVRSSPRVSPTLPSWCSGFQTCRHSGDVARHLLYRARPLPSQTGDGFAELAVPAA